MKACGACTACCKDLELHEIPSAIGELCRFCTLGVGCQIYEERPKECAVFQCMWSQMEEVGDELRPDRCGVIFSRSSEDVIAARIDADRLMTPLAMRQIEEFSVQGFSVVVFRGAECRVHLATGHSNPYVMEAIRGCTVLHD